MNQDKHEFSFFVANLTALLHSVLLGDQVIFDDKELVHRIIRVVRLQKDDTLILFDRTHHARIILTVEKDAQIGGILQSKAINKQIKPAISFFLPLLKREALEAAVYSLVELGATEIHLVVTNKSQQKMSDKEQVRLQRIIYAAAEQSKNYAFPVLHEPQPLALVLENKNYNHVEKFFFASNGQPILSMLHELKLQAVPSLVLMVGPEGDLFASEKALLKEHHFKFCILTPTILRAQQAVAVSLGLFRVLL